MRFNSKSHILRRLPRRRVLPFGGLLLVTAWASIAAPFAQTIDGRQWQGANATSRQAEHIVASTISEWRSLWGRVGLAPPDHFEPGRMNAVGIFLGRRSSEGYSVNVLSTARRRDRIVVVFEERMPAELMLAQRAAPRPVSGGGGSLGPGSTSFAPSSGASPASALPAPTPTNGHPTSPWAIILINRADLPVSVEQRLR